jgi:methionyl-tRNA synthetase
VANILQPFLPFSSSKIKKWLGSDTGKYEYIKLEVDKQIGKFEILFERLDKKIVEEELEKLNKL